MTGTGVTHTQEPIRLATLPSGRDVATTVHRYEGTGSGPTIYLQALQHGGEVNGAAVLRRLHERLQGASLAGEVIAVPVANPLAFDHRVYMGPTRLDAINSNMNRLWPGDADGTLMERMVDRLWTIAADADAVLDLHTGGPYMLTHTRFTPGDERSRDLATAMGIDPIVADGEPEGSDGQDEEAQGKLRAVAAAADVPAITPELAHSREIVDDSVAAGLEGLVNVLRSLDVLGPAPSSHDPAVARDKTAIFTDESGLFRSADVAVGDHIAAGTEIGTVFDPSTYEDRQPIEAPTGGMVLSLNRGATVVEGESVGSIVQVD
jgi:predicted deacylase